MTATLESRWDVISSPAETAREISRLNQELAAQTGITDAVSGAVHQVAAGVVEQSAIEYWETIDPYLALMVHRAVIQAEEAIRRDDAVSRDQLRIALESLRQGFASLAENEPVGDARTPKEIARWLADTAEVPQNRLAELLGVSHRQFQRWLSAQERSEPEGNEARRLRAVARIVNQLRFSLTPGGAVDWFTWPRDDLGGAAPLEVLDDPARLPELAAIAGSMRSTYVA
jgi:DNA-binding transcriptional regulator YiaG